jgi:hypothetical protein
MKNLAGGIRFLRFSALKRRDISAQGEALRNGSRQAQALKGRYKIQRITVIAELISI